MAAQLTMLVSPVNFQLSGNRKPPFITRKTQGAGGTQAVPELAGRVGLIWMESHLCHLPSDPTVMGGGAARPKTLPASHCPLGPSRIQ